jgi:phosphate transport system substrate-binding protein
VYELAAVIVLLAGSASGSVLAQSAARDDLKTFPVYVPKTVVSGVIRNSGSSLGGLLNAWERGFTKLQPGIRFADDLRSGDAAIGAIESGAADLAINGREPVLTEFLSFAEVFGNDGPFQVTVATGSFDVLGRTWAEVIYVNRDNPLAHLTMDQLDGYLARHVPAATRATNGHPRRQEPRQATFVHGGNWDSRASGRTSRSTPTVMRRPACRISSS